MFNMKNDLLDTKDKLIIQCNPYDTMWSNGLKMKDENVEDSTKWKGQNLLGQRGQRGQRGIEIRKMKPE